MAQFPLRAVGPEPVSLGENAYEGHTTEACSQALLYHMDSGATLLNWRYS